MWGGLVKENTTYGENTTIKRKITQQLKSAKTHTNLVFSRRSTDIGFYFYFRKNIQWGKVGKGERPGIRHIHKKKAAKNWLPTGKAG